MVQAGGYIRAWFHIDDPWMAQANDPEVMQELAVEWGTRGDKANNWCPLCMSLMKQMLSMWWLFITGHVSYWHCTKEMTTGCDFNNDGLWKKHLILPKMLAFCMKFIQWPHGVHLPNEELPSSYLHGEARLWLLQYHHEDEEKRIQVVTMNPGIGSLCWACLKLCWYPQFHRWCSTPWGCQVCYRHQWKRAILLFTQWWCKGNGHQCKDHGHQGLSKTRS